MKIVKMCKYRLDKEPDKGFCIQEHNQIKYKKGISEKTGKKIYTIWYDPYEGGEASEGDWSSVENGEYPNIPKYGEWLNFNDAFNWIINNYGNITLIDK